MPSPPTLDTIAAALARHGLVLRGAFHPVPADGVPDGDGGPAGTLVLAGNVGPAMWAAFDAAPERYAARDALDAWTRRVAGEVAREIGARALYPFGGPPHWPFQRWAMRAESIAPSPLGILIHTRHGLWHAYRAAFALPARAALAEHVDEPSPCLACSGRPCLSACPADAFTTSGYDVAACRRHAGGAEGAACREGGCRARLACPVARDLAYVPEQQRFHMAAFLAAGRDRSA